LKLKAIKELDLVKKSTLDYNNLNKFVCHINPY